MKTDHLIDALATGLEPVRPAKPSPLWLTVAAAAAFAAVAALLGLRPDFAAGLQTTAPWLKAGYALAIAGAALWLAQRLGRPGADPRPALWTMLAIVAVAAAGGLIEAATTPPADRLAQWLGRTWAVCGRNILLVSLISGPLVFLSARSLAPTRPSAAGAALGVASGALAATAYGLLRCSEPSAAFVATWYTVGIAAAGVLGAGLGRVALRW